MKNLIQSLAKLLLNILIISFNTFAAYYILMNVLPYSLLYSMEAAAFVSAISISLAALAVIQIIMIAFHVISSIGMLIMSLPILNKVFRIQFSFRTTEFYRQYYSKVRS